MAGCHAPHQPSTLLPGGQEREGGGRTYFSHRVFNLKNIPVLPSKNDTKMFKMSNMAENYFRIAKMRSRGDFS